MLFRRSKHPSPAAQRLRSLSAFESRTEQWRQVGLGSEIDRAEEQRARGGIVLFGGAIALVLALFSQRATLFPDLGTPVRVATVAALVVLGWGLARTLGRGLAAPLYRRLEPGTAGIIGFLIRLITIGVMLVVALRIAGLDTGTLAAGGAFTAVILGLAAQQTLGNIFAGLVLLTTRPFRVGERIRITGGMMAGSIEGIVASLGLFYVTLISGADKTMIPNSAMLQLAVSPLREPERVELRARFDAETNPAEVQSRVQEGVSVPLRYPPDITLEELDRSEVVVKIAATPQNPADGAQLAGEIVAAVREDGGHDETAERDGVGTPA